MGSQKKKDNKSWLEELNEAQRQAATFGEGPLIIVAGAGSGKTKTLASRVAWLLTQGIDPQKILLLTFTRRAAEEMLKRASQAVGSSGQSAVKVWGGTFHSTANRLLRIYSEAAGLNREFTIMDQTDAEDFLDILRNELAVDKTGARFPRKSTCLAIYSRKVNGTESLDYVLKKYFPWCVRWKNELTELFRLYVERKQSQNVLDYDDLLLYWYLLLEDGSIAESMENRFTHILVDEYQDTNPIQSGILRRMRQKNKNITVVGDDAQSIYSFRSATVRNMLDFPKHFPGAAVITLEQNYRSVEPILNTTNVLISQARERFSKNLFSTRLEGSRPELVTCFDETFQDEAVIGRVLARYEEGIPLHNQAVLFRAASNSASLEIALSRKNIPFVKYGGLRFLEAAHIKDLLSFLRVLENPRDERAWFRMLQLFKGIGPAIAADIFKFISGSQYSLGAVGSYTGGKDVSGHMKKLSALFNDCAEKGLAPSEEIERIFKLYRPLLKELYENPDQRAADIEQLAGLASGYETRGKFLTDLMLDPPSFTGDLAGKPIMDEDYLILSTIHSAKGCEWDAVYLIHAADGCLPSDMATGSAEEIEEELRLAYVAMTRARDYLTVLWPKRFYSRPAGFSDNHVYAQLSRFFTPEVLFTMIESSAGAVEEEKDKGSILKPIESVQSKLKGMW